MEKFWTEERVELLRKLWTTNRSTTDIAVMVGAPTKNAVIGKAHRLALPARQHKSHGQSVRTVDRPQGWSYRGVREGAGETNKRERAFGIREKLPKMNPNTMARFWAEPDAVGDSEKTKVPPFETPAHERKLFGDLEPHHCRFPFGTQTPYEFCGRKKVQGLSYCADHARACLAPSLPKSTQPRVGRDFRIVWGVGSARPKIAATAQPREKEDVS